MAQPGAQPPTYSTVQPVQQQQVVYTQPVQGQQPVVIQQPITGQQPQVIYVQQPQTTQVVVQNPTRFPQQSTLAICPKCQVQVQTVVTLEPGLGTWAGCGTLCLVGFWCGCCLIPFCIDDLKDAHHNCPTCGTLLGSKKVFQ
eukprot:350103_1